MGIFDFVNSKVAGGNNAKKSSVAVDTAMMTRLALDTIHDGVIIVNKDGIIRFINPAAVEMTGCGNANNAINLNLDLIMKFEGKDGSKINEADNNLFKAVKSNTSFMTREYVLLAGEDEKKTPVAVSITPSGGATSDRVVTFRDISKELEEEGAQTEFVSTASHEMRTPIASIEGYIGLALNPQTATIDARARQYLESAHASSQHLGRLFKDLLDATKLDDHRIRPHAVPMELNGFVKKFAEDYTQKFAEKRLQYSFGAEDKKTNNFGGRILKQVVYTFADPDFLGEILANLIENAIKYTPEGGAIWVNVQGDGDRALINVTDTGIGIGSEDLQHIFQKFYRADNSHTRTVGGTGLGLYLVKQRVEAMNGKVWAESSFGEGSTFYVSLPRLSDEEYERRQIAIQNQKAVAMFQDQVKTAEDIAMQNAQAAATTPQFNPALVQQPVQQAAPQPAVAQPMMGVQTIAPVQPTQQVAPQVQPVASQAVAPQPAPQTQLISPVQQPQPVMQGQPVAMTQTPIAPVIQPAQGVVQAPTAPPQVQYGQVNQNIIQ